MISDDRVIEPLRRPNVTRKDFARVDSNTNIEGRESPIEPDQDLAAKVTEMAESRIDEALTLSNKAERNQAMAAVAEETGEWRLFDVVKDPGEAEDLSEEMPDKLKSLIAAWDRYAEEVGVILPE